MSALPTMYQCFHTTKGFCVLVIVLLLVVCIGARNNRNKSRKDHGENQQLTEPISNQTYDSPSLVNGNSYSRGGNYGDFHNGHGDKNNAHHHQRHPRRHEQFQNHVLTSTYSDTPEAPSHEEPTEEALPGVPIEDFNTKKQIRILQIKERILKKLNLGTKAPNVTGVVESSNPVITNLKQKVDESNNKIPHDSAYMQQDMPEEFNDKKIFIPVEDKYPFDWKVPNETDIMYFKMNQGQASEAVLHLWLRPVRVPVKTIVTLEVYEILKPVHEGDLVRMAASSWSDYTLEPSKGFWVRILLLQLVSKWVKNPDANLGVAVVTKFRQYTSFAVTNARDIPEKAPLLEVQFTKEGNKSNRIARSSEGGKCAQGETKCCRFPLPINFTEHSFDFIVAPKVYMANMCNGKCDYLYAQQFLHMSVVQKLHNATATYGPCCGAKELMPLNMLYYDHDRKIRFDVINDMIVEKCSCD